MTKYIRFILILSLIIAAAIPLFSEELVLTLDECISRGIALNDELAAAEYENRAADATLQAAQALRYPFINLQAGYSRTNPQDELAIPTSPTTSLTLSPSIEDNWFFTISVRQNIFSGFKVTSAIDTADAVRNASHATTDKIRSETVFSITRAFLGLVKAEMLFQVTEERVQAVSLHNEEMSHLFTQGLATNAEVQAAQLALSSAKMQRIEAENSVAVARAQLALLIGLPLETIIISNHDIVKVNLPPESLEAVIEKAKRSRPELNAARMQIRVYEVGLTAASSAFYPSLFLQGNFTCANPNQQVFPREAQFNGTWGIGLVFSLDIGAYPETFARTEEARHKLAASRKRYEQLENAVDLEIYTAYLDCKKSQDRLSVAEQMMQQTAEILRITSEKQKQGLATTADVLDTRISWLSAKLEYTRTGVDAEIAYKTLEYKEGILWNNNR